MATTFSITPVSQTVKDSALGQVTAVTFTVSRSGDISKADTENWSVVDDPNVTNGVEKNFFFIPNGSQTTNGEPSGQVAFVAGSAAAQAPITVYLKGGIDVLPSNFDWGTFDLGVKLGVATASTSGFSDSASGGYGVTVNDYIVNGDGGTLSLDYNMYTIPDQADVYLNGREILTTGGPVSDIGSLTYPGNGQVALHAGDDVQVVLTGSIQGTAWDYTINYAPGLSAVVEGHTTIDTGIPGVAELARLSNDVYNGSPGANVNGYKPILVSGTGRGSVPGANIDAGYPGFQAYAYENANDNQIVIAFRGTDPGSKLNLLKNILSDSTWFGGVPVPSPDFIREMKDAVAFVNQVKAIAAQTGAAITLTGHSLGGGVAQALGLAGGYTTVAFNAPGTRLVEPVLQATGVLNGLQSSATGSLRNDNYRMDGDQVSLAGFSVGNQYTIPTPFGDSISSVLANHRMTTVLSALTGARGTNVATLGQGGPNYLATLRGAPGGTAIGLGLQALGFVVSAGVNVLVDPESGRNFVFLDDAASPDLTSVTLPADTGVAQFRIETLTSNGWQVSGFATPGNTFSLVSGARGVEFVPMDSSGNVVPMETSFYFQSSYAANGKVSATFRSETGDETNFDDFNGDTTSDVLWVNSAGQTDLWKIAGEKWAGSVTIGTHPGGSQIAGIGDFNGDGTKDVLWVDSSSNIADIWNVSNGQWTGSVSPGAHPGGYKVAAVGDFNGDGTSDILWSNSSTGDVDEWKIVNSNWAGSVDLGAHPGPGWQIAGTGDFNNDGASDILWFNSSTNQTDVWEMANGHWAASTNPGAHPAGYQVVGVGDFNGDGSSDVLWYNASSGDVDEWLIKNGTWAGSVDIGKHPSGWQVAGTGDYNGDGVSDVLWTNPASGQTDIWTLANGQWQASVSVGTHPTSWSVAS